MIVAILFTGLFLSFFSSYISVEVFWLGPMIAMTFPVFALALILIIGISFKSQKLSPIKLILVLILSITHYWNHFSIIKNSSDNNDFKFMSFNARLFDIYNWIDREAWADWAPRTDNGRVLNSIYRTIENENPDVLCIQEFYYKPNSSYSTTDTLKKLGYKYQHIEYLYNDISNGVQHYYGIATFSKFPIINKQKLQNDKHFHNGALSSDIQIGQKTVRILNVHFESFRFDKNNYNTVRSFYNTAFDSINTDDLSHLINVLKRGYKRRNKEVELVEMISNESNLPTILACDLNEPPSSNSYKTLNTTLNDAFISSGQGISSTVTFNYPLRIDYIFHSNDMESTNYRVIQDQELSDHYPISTNFILEP